MEILNTVKSWVSGISQLLVTLVGLAVLAEVAFGQFLGQVSVIDNIIEVVTRFGERGFIGLVALIAVFHFTNKK
jgi:hypothetical protein